VPESDLDKHEAFTISHDDIDLATAAIEIALQRFQAFPPEK